MTRPAKGGRPRIGEPVSVVLPDQVLTVVDERAAQRGVTRSEQLRDLVSGADRLDVDLPEGGGGLEREVAPAADLIVRWIGQAPDVTQARARFRAYHKVAGNHFRLVQLITQAWGHLYLDGARDLEPPPAALLERLGERREWRLRGVNLYTAVIGGLARAGVALGGEAGEEEEIPEPEYGEGEYA